MSKSNNKKKKIVYFSTPAFGHLNAEYPVISKLIENGYSKKDACREIANKYGVSKNTLYNNIKEKWYEVGCWFR